MALRALDRYTIERELGSGTMGSVYLAYDTRLRRRVALKILSSGVSDMGVDALAATMREARAAGSIAHPNAAAIFDASEANGVAYIVMEYVPGTPLRRFIGDSSVPMEVRVRWLVDIAGALATAHVAGVIHRDVKPENVLVRDDGIVKVLDFGIAKIADTASEALRTVSGNALTWTGDGGFVGTPGYIAPEVMRGQPADGRTDQFAWGVLAYELLSGHTPWKRSETAVGLIAAVLTQQPDPLGPDVPPAVAGVVARALSKAPEERFPSLAHAAFLIADFADTSAALRVPAEAPRLSPPPRQSEPTAAREPAAARPATQPARVPTGTLASGSLAPREEPTSTQRSSDPPGRAPILPRPVTMGPRAAPYPGPAEPGQLTPRDEAHATSSHPPLGSRLDAALSPPAPRAAPVRSPHETSSPRQASHDGAASGSKPRAPAEPSAHDGAAGGPKPRAPAEPTRADTHGTAPSRVAPGRRTPVFPVRPPIDPRAEGAEDPFAGRRTPAFPQRPPLDPRAEDTGRRTPAIAPRRAFEARADDTPPTPVRRSPVIPRPAFDPRSEDTPAAPTTRRTPALPPRQPIDPRAEDTAPVVGRRTPVIPPRAAPFSAPSEPAHFTTGPRAAPADAPPTTRRTPALPPRRQHDARSDEPPPSSQPTPAPRHAPAVAPRRLFEPQSDEPPMSGGPLHGGPVGFRPPSFTAPVDVQAHIAMLPADATCKGMFFTDLFALAAKIHSPMELSLLAGIPDRRYVGFRDYPMKDKLQLTVAVAATVYPRLSLGEALRRIGQRALGLVLDSHVGRTLFGVLPRDVEHYLMQGPKAYRMLVNFGEVMTERVSPTSFRLHAREMPLFLETYQMGVIEGVLEHCNARGEVLIGMTDLANASVSIRLR